MIDTESFPSTNISTIDLSGISDEAITIFTWVVIAGVCQVIDTFGVVTNIINIVCFVKQGFKEPVNISLLGLAVSDLGCLITQIGLNLFYTLTASNADLPFDALDVCYLMVAMPHLTFSRVNTWITAIITLERCLCITAPLKVKNIVTSKRVAFTIISVYVIFIFSGAPVYAVSRLDMIFFPLKNRTLLGLVSTADRQQVESITFTANSFVMPFVAFVVIIVCTSILVINLQKRTKWQKASVTALQVDHSFRNQKVAKMVVMISALFIVCFIPLAVILLAMALVPSLGLGGQFIKIGQVVGSVGLLMESINSSANIFIYYHMSTKYKETFHLIFYKCKVW